VSSLYNELDPFAVEWLRNLAQAGHIAPGTVDARSIKEIQPDDVRPLVQFHAFAGIGAWSYALRLAGWPDDLPVWTGSCPCQPFSSAGKRGGFDDKRHLWPEWFRLIRECRPPVVFGEQVASPDGLKWFDAVSADLEAEGYAVGAADLCAAGVGAPHIRQRLYFVAVSGEQRRRGLGLHLRERGPLACVSEALGGGAAGLVGDAGSPGVGRDPGGVLSAEGKGEGERGAVGGVLNEPFAPGPTNGFWANAEWLPCRDGKVRPVEPGTFPLAHGIAGRVGRLRAYGNAISPQVAAAFIRAFLDWEHVCP
jgi:DNA (cytosine-5)-methyltransferase 1